MNPSLADVWKVLAEIKLRQTRKKLVLDVEILKGNYKDLKESLEFTKSQVESRLKQIRALKKKSIALKRTMKK